MKAFLKKIICLGFAAAILISAMPTILTHAEKTDGSETVQESPELIEGETLDDGNIVYTKSKNGAYVTSCNNNMTNVTIKADLDGYKIAGIYDGAFYGCPNLRSVTVEEGIEYIGTGAFYGCPKLTEVKLPESVTVIPNYCFYGCSNLKSVDIPDTVKSVGAYSFSLTPIDSFSLTDKMKDIGFLAFSGCKNLSQFTVSDKNERYKENDGILYSKDGETLEIFPSGKNLTEFSVPDTVSEIAPGAFSDCKILESIYIPNSVKSISEEAFFRCGSLEKINLPKGLTAIENYLFCDCSSLKSIDIPDSVTSIGSGAFYGCTALKSVNVPDSVINVGEDAFGFTDDMGTKEKYKIEDFTLNANYDTAAGKYARSNHISIDYTDGNPYTIFFVIGIAVAIAAIVILIIILKKRSDKKSETSDNTEEESDNEE